MINYVILVSDEHEYLERLLEHLLSLHIDKRDIIVIVDIDKTHHKVREILTRYEIIYYLHSLNGDFASQRNFAKEQCGKPFIFYIDVDELISEKLVFSLNEIIHRQDIDVIGISRLNLWINDTNEELPYDIGPPPDDKGRVNWPDYQYRFIKNDKDIIWKNKVHEQICCDTRRLNAGRLCDDESIAITHTKKVSDKIKHRDFYYKIIQDNK